MLAALDKNHMGVPVAMTVSQTMPQLSGSVDREFGQGTAQRHGGSTVVSGTSAGRLEGWGLRTT